MNRYLKTATKYFKLGANNKKYLIMLSLTAVLRTLLQLLPPIFIALIIDSATIKDFDSAFRYVVCLAFSYFVYNIAHHYNYVFYALNSNYTMTKLHKLIIEKAMTLDLNYTKKMSKSFLLNTLNKDARAIYAFPDYLFDCIAALIGLIAALIILLVNNLYLGLLAIMVVIIFIVLNGYLDKMKSHYLFYQRSQADKITSLIGQTLEGTKEVKQFEMKEKLNKHLDKELKEWEKYYFKKRFYWDRRDVLTPFLLHGLKIIIYIIAIYLIINGKTTIGFLVLMVNYLDKIEDQVYSFARETNRISRIMSSIDRLFIALNFKSKDMQEFGGYNKDDIKGIVEFKNVNFKYEKKLILKDINFKIMPNSLTAIVGKSGCGKSTIFRLLLRQYNISSGEVLIDGVNIFDYTKEVYPNNVSIATQKPFIFNMSIRDNLNLVNENKEEQIKACKRVGLHRFITELPKGYNTILKEDATNLSGGQKQLLALARVILSGSEILLFDEVTSSLDPNTAKKVMKILKQLKKDHSVIIITHKPELMKIVDDIIVIDKGSIVGRGSHKKLKTRNEYYKKLQ